jgi:RNA polymerase II subunit A-like phosphatase
VDTKTTHVIAAKKGTQKVNQAKKLPGVFIVKPEWLLMCSSTWTKVPEKDYILEYNLAVPTRLDVLSVPSDQFQVDEEDLALLTTTVDVPISAHFNEDDWAEMDREVEEAMNEDDSNFNSLDDEIDEELDVLLSGEDLFSGEAEESVFDETLKRKRPDDEVLSQDGDRKSRLR